MAEYIDREDAINRMREHPSLSTLKYMPAADVVAVVRCRNCKHSAVGYNSLINNLVCVCKAERVRTVPLDGYCHRGEARADEL